MTWITKTIFIGSDGNKTTEINESISIEWAHKNRIKQIQRWYKIIVIEDNFNDFPTGLDDVLTHIEDENVVEFQLDVINFTLQMKNKYLKPLRLNSFTVSVYEDEPYFKEVNMLTGTIIRMDFV